MLLTKCHQIQLPETSKARLPEGILSTADGRLSRARVYIVTRRINGGYQYILLWDIVGADNFRQGWWSVPTFTSLDKFGTKHKTGVWETGSFRGFPGGIETSSWGQRKAILSGFFYNTARLRKDGSGTETAGLGGPWSAWSIRQKVR